jgi:ribose 5-phosphate isomerase B
MKIYIGADHNGFEMKRTLVDELTRAGYTVVDESGDIPNPEDDFPQFAARVVVALKASDDPESYGVLICGSGQGM